MFESSTAQISSTMECNVTEQFDHSLLANMIVNVVILTQDIKIC